MKSLLEILRLVGAFVLVVLLFVIVRALWCAVLDTVRFFRIRHSKDLNWLGRIVAEGAESGSETIETVAARHRMEQLLREDDAAAWRIQ